MTLRRRALALLLVLVTAAFGAPAAAVADDNAAVAVNTTDGSSVFDLALDIEKVASGAVDQTNLAVAYSSCTECRTVAIAIQIVIVVGSATTVTPQNIAIAINEGCDTCQTLASAYQFVIGVDGPFRFTREGRKRIKAIQRALKELADPDIPIDEVQRRLDVLMHDLADVLDNEIVQLPRRDDRDDEDPEQEERSDRQRPEPSATPTATPEPASTPDPVPTPTPEASPTATPTATPEPTATPDAAPTP